MIKNKLVAPTLQILFAIMSEEEEDEEEDDDDDDEDHVESSKPCTVAAQTLNEMALHLPPDKIVTPLLHWAEPAIRGIIQVIEKHIAIEKNIYLLVYFF